MAAPDFPRGGVTARSMRLGTLAARWSLEDSALAPAIEALKNAVPLAKALGQVTPRRARLGYPQNCVHEQAVVLGGCSWVACLSRQQIFNRIPVLVRNLMTSQHRHRVSDGIAGHHHAGSRVPIVGGCKAGRRCRLCFEQRNFPETAATSTITQTQMTKAPDRQLPPLRQFPWPNVNRT